MLLTIAAFLALGYLGVILFATLFQNRLAFPGDRGSLPHPAQAGLPDAELVFIDTPDSVRLAGWYIPPAGAPSDAGSPGVVWFHGNRENVGELAPFLMEFRYPHAGILIVDYRGYGQSEGRPTEANVYADAELMYDWLAMRPEIDRDRVALYGRSVGSAVALELAQRRPVVGVFLDSPFSSARDMGRRHYPFLPAFLGRLRLDNVGNAQRLTVPLQVIHGEDDFIAPVDMGEAVASAGQGRITVLPNVGHNEMYTADPALYREQLHAFLRDVFVHPADQP